MADETPGAKVMREAWKAAVKAAADLGLRLTAGGLWEEEALDERGRYRLRLDFTTETVPEPPHG